MHRLRLHVRLSAEMPLTPKLMSFPVAMPRRAANAAAAEAAGAEAAALRLATAAAAAG